jgi:tetratricopeptide (TPR) repeat protein
MFLEGFISASISFVLMTGSLAQIQGTDTLYGPSDLHYFSTLEGKSFSKYFDGKPDYFKMIIGVNANNRESELEIYQDWISDIFHEIRQKKFDRLSKAKKINQVKNLLSQTLLTSFEHKSGFSDMFKFGNYNYYTAASLYAIILDSLGIPSQIREVSNSILLLSYPDDERITIEIEGPGAQFFAFAHEIRNDFVKFLRESNAIDEATFASTTTRVLFERYFFADYELTIREIIGMLYLNSAIDYLNRSEPANAYYQFEKAFILHPSFKTQYLLLAHLNSFLLAMDYHNPRDLGYLIKASRLIGFGIQRERITGFLENIIHEVLVKEQDPDAMQYIFDYMQEYLADEGLKKEFSFLFYYETGRLHFNEEQYWKALTAFETAYSMKPDNDKNQDLLARALVGYSISASPAMVLEKIHLYDTAYTGIVDNEIYLTIKLHVCLEFFGEAFQLQDGENGEHYMAIFEEMADQYPDISIVQLAVGRSYSSAAIYYYRQGRVEKSRELLKKGLQYSPHNLELNLKLKSFE